MGCFNVVCPWCGEKHQYAWDPRFDYLPAILRCKADRSKRFRVDPVGTYRVKVTKIR